MSNIGEIL